MVISAFGNFRPDWSKFEIYAQLWTTKGKEKEQDLAETVRNLPKLSSNKPYELELTSGYSTRQSLQKHMQEFVPRLPVIPRSPSTTATETDLATIAPSQITRAMSSHSFLSRSNNGANVEWINARFEHAVDIISSLPRQGPVQTSYDDKLELYSVYKQGKALANSDSAWKQNNNKHLFWER